jgi:hypothetical protein
MNIIYFMSLYASIGVFILFASLNSFYYLIILGLGIPFIVKCRAGNLPANGYFDPQDRNVHAQQGYFRL